MSVPPPAVLLITADQLRQDALGCYGNRAVATPNLDRLAADGTVFDQAYTASPWCLPSRSSIVTGRYPRNHGAYSNFRHHRLSPELPNLYSTLKHAGYVTSHIGKCHYAPVPYAETRPDRTLPYQEFHDYYRTLGIDHLDLQDGKQVSVWFSDDYAKELDGAGHLAAYREAVWNREHRKVFTFPGPAEWHPDSWVGRKSVERITSYEADAPFFGWISFSGPHFPFDPPAEYLDRVDESALAERALLPGELDSPDRIHHRSWHGPARGWIEGGVGKDHTPEYWHRLRHYYHANVALIDDQIGAILDAAEQRFGDNLLVVFTCDHGEMLGNHGIWGKNHCFYSDVLRVPLLLRRPGKVNAGGRTDRLVSLVDIYPTMTSGAGVAPDPATDGQHLDHADHDHVYAEGEGFAVVTDGVYKLVRLHRDGTTYTELFDLRTDPHEFHDVAGREEHATIERDLQSALLGALLDSALP